VRDRTRSTKSPLLHTVRVRINAVLQEDHTVTDTAPILPTATTTDAGAAHAAVAVLSVGSFEQHGPYLPLVTDTLIAAAIADAIAGHHENVFQLLAIAYGCSHEHAAFPGTVSISATTLSAVIAESCAQQGITALIIINAHGGNAVLTNVAQQANVHGPLAVGSTPAVKTGPKPAPPRASPAASTTTCMPANSKRPSCSPRTRTLCATVGIPPITTHPIVGTFPLSASAPTPTPASLANHPKRQKKRDLVPLTTSAPPPEPSSACSWRQV
jgi:hypothetical protein